MAQQLNQELIRRMLDAQSNPVEPFDPTQITKGAIQGESLAETILKNKQAQEDRVRSLQEKIAAAKREAQYKKAAGAANPDIANEINFLPKESGESILKSKLAAQSDEAKLARARLRQEADGQAPDKIKQLFQVGDKVVGVTYGGKVQPIEAPGQLNPLKKTLPADASQQLADFDTLSQQLDTVKTTFKPEFTGPIQARTGELAQTLDMPSLGLGASQPRSDFYSNVNSIRNQLLYLRSGKQINEKEYERLLAELPNEKRSDVDFSAKLANFEKVFNEIKLNRRNALATGYNIPGSASPAPAAGNPGKTGGFKVISVRPSGGQ